MHSYFDTEIPFTASPTPMCEDGELSWYQSEFNSSTNSISGLPFICVDGQFSLICYDSSYGPDSARVLCTAFDYYGELACNSLFPCLGVIVVCICLFACCDVGGGMFVNTLESPPQGTGYVGNLTCMYDTIFTGYCSASPLEFCETSILGLTCFELGTQNSTSHCIIFVWPQSTLHVNIYMYTFFQKVKCKCRTDCNTLM